MTALAVLLVLIGRAESPPTFASTGTSTAPDLLSLVERYEKGAYAEAVTELTDGLASHRIGPHQLSPASCDMRCLRTATLLYTEAAALALRQGRRDVADESLAEARALSDHLLDQGFRSRWRLAVGYELQGYVLLTLAERYFEECLKAADQSRAAEAQALLAAGSIHEINSTFEGLENHGPAGPTSASSLVLPEFLRRARLAQESGLAEGIYQKALKADPALAEAHLRLGRVWQRQGRGADARREMQWVLQNSRDSYLLFMAHIFLGTLEEALEHPAEAVAQFQAAVDLEPRAQSARLGLSFAQRANGQGAASRAAVRQALERPARSDRSPGDPWLLYHLGLYRLFEPTLRELREGGTR